MDASLWFIGEVIEYGILCDTTTGMRIQSYLQQVPYKKRKMPAELEGRDKCSYRSLLRWRHQKEMPVFLVIKWIAGL
jgi:hypothetical protein